MAEHSIIKNLRHVNSTRMTSSGLFTVTQATENRAVKETLSATSRNMRDEGTLQTLRMVLEIAGGTVGPLLMRACKQHIARDTDISVVI